MLGSVKVDRKERFLFSDSLLRVTLFFQKNVDHALLQERYQTVSVVFSIFFVSCKQILSHTLFLVVSRLEKKKKKHTWVC